MSFFVRKNSGLFGPNPWDRVTLIYNLQIRIVLCNNANYMNVFAEMFIYLLIHFYTHMYNVYFEAFNNLEFI
jgi:hypothetical protein